VGAALAISPNATGSFSTFSSHILRGCGSGRTRSGPASARLGLTARELQVLAWVARGSTNQQIAETLWIAPTTVRKHLENIYAKLGVRTRTAAAARLLATLDDLDEAI
jgi:DNA-binding CsgD family transcriptional regulator